MPNGKVQTSEHNMKPTTYEPYWKLSRKPFSYRAGCNEMFASRTLQSASLRLRYCFDNNASAALLLGVSGVGKTSLLQQLRDRDERLKPFAHVIFPTLSYNELARVVVAELSDADGNSVDTMDVLMQAAVRAIAAASEQNRHCVVAFDEAHLLSTEALNQVVLPLLNLGESDHRISMTVVLCGQPSLASHVARNAQLRERIAVTATLEGFTEEETRQYIHSRLHFAGATEPIFTDDAIRSVFELSGGNPRRINRLCDMALLVGSADQLESISGPDIEALSCELLPAAA
ncbi:MAG: AAA family ATPase [Planctomycetaceae bacterium]|nr:AAA family ATPase [Planctomycetaceae bacterium]